MKETIVAISGKPGLYKLLSRSKNSLIVEAVDESHKRLPVFATDRVTSLNDIAMYTNTDDVPLTKVLTSLYKVAEEKPVTLNYKKCSSKELREFFAKVLPDFDNDRIHDSDLKKLFQWYDILVKNGITDFEATAEDKTKTEKKADNEKEG
ncbi:MAG: DUF5606 domain-containing protein [Prevotella sp.]|nr:DUF5606 domain-containing protein [Prevotella sp.]